jgi:hypothetical protein
LSAHSYRCHITGVVRLEWAHAIRLDHTLHDGWARNPLGSGS